MIMDKKIVQMMLNGLPKSYQTFVSIQRALHEPPNLEALTLSVELEERTQDSMGVQDVSGISAAMVNRGGRGGRLRGRGSRGGNYGGDRASFSKTKPFSQVKDSKYFSEFILDSGSTQNSTNCVGDIISNSLQACTEKILSADDSEMICSGKGEVRIIVDNVGSILTLKNVRLIPSTRHKIMSLEHLLKQNYTLVSKSPEMLVLSRRNSPKLVFQIPP